MPIGRIARICRSSGSRASVNGWISQYTDCSRIRRAISWVYWEPKSRTRISWCAMSLHAVVGGFLGDDHVVDAALDALGHELLRRLDLGLEVAVLRAVLHRTDRAHAAVRLVRPPLVQDDLA